MNNSIKGLSVVLLLTLVIPAQGMFRAGLSMLSRRPALSLVAASIPFIAPKYQIFSRVSVSGKGTYEEDSRLKKKSHVPGLNKVALFAANAGTYAQCVVHENQAYRAAKTNQQFEALMAPHASKCGKFTKWYMNDFLGHPTTWRYDDKGATPFMSDLYEKTGRKFNPWKHNIRELSIDVKPVGSAQTPSKAEFTFKALFDRELNPKSRAAAQLYKLRNFNKEYAQCMTSPESRSTKQCRALGATFKNSNVTFSDFDVNVEELYQSPSQDPNAIRFRAVPCAANPDINS